MLRPISRRAGKLQGGGKRIGGRKENDYSKQEGGGRRVGAYQESGRDATDATERDREGEASRKTHVCSKRTATLDLSGVYLRKCTRCNEMRGLRSSSSRSQRLRGKAGQEQNPMRLKSSIIISRCLRHSSWSRGCGGFLPRSRIRFHYKTNWRQERAQLACLWNHGVHLARQQQNSENCVATFTILHIYDLSYKMFQRYASDFRNHLSRVLDVIMSEIATGKKPELPPTAKLSGSKYLSWMSLWGRASSSLNVRSVTINSGDGTVSGSYVYGVIANVEPLSILCCVTIVVFSELLHGTSMELAAFIWWSNRLDLNLIFSPARSEHYLPRFNCTYEV